MRIPLFALGAAALVLAGCGSSSPAAPTVHSFTAEQVGTDLVTAIGADANFQGVTVGPTACDSPLNHVGDVSLCQTSLTGGSYFGGYVISVTLSDGNGHVKFRVDHPTN